MAGPGDNAPGLARDDAGDKQSTSSDTMNFQAGAERAASNGKQTTSRSQNETDALRDAALQKELSSVRKVNEALEGVIQNLDRAKSNMATVNSSVGAASTLLDTWSRILSQTEHNQRVILSPSFEGLSKEMADIVTEAQNRQQAAHRREAEEQERKAAAARRAEEAEQRRLVESTKPQTTSTRGRGRGSSRITPGTKPPSSGYGQSDTSTSSAGRGSSYSGRRAAIGIGRVSRGSSRGRG